MASKRTVRLGRLGFFGGAAALAAVSFVGLGSSSVLAATLTFTTPGAQTPFTVPAGVCGYTVTALGASGGAGRAAETEGVHDQWTTQTTDPCKSRFLGAFSPGE